MNTPFVFRKCKKCGRWLVANTFNFYKHKGGKYGLRAECKECVSAYSKEHYKENEEYYKNYREENKNYYSEYHKKWYKENREKKKEYDKKWYKENKQRREQEQVTF